MSNDTDRFNPHQHIGVDVAWTPKQVKSIRCKKGTPQENYQDAVVSDVRVLGRNGKTYTDQLLFGKAIVSIATKEMGRGDLPLTGAFEYVESKNVDEDGKPFTYLTFTV